jgi:hypothetical protein
MISKIEVSRELLEVIANSSERTLTEINAAIQQARSILAAPVVERKLSFAEIASASAYCQKTPELAELQAELTRYKSLFDQAQKALDRVNALHTKRMAATFKELQSTIAQQAAEIERLKGGQGEPVYQVCNGVDGWIDVDRLRYTACQLDPEEYETRVLFTSQPAPVSVDERAEFVAWVRREWPQAPLSNIRDLLPKNDPRYGEYCDEALQRAWVGWQARACLDKVKDLNQWLPIAEPTNKESAQ